MEFDKLIRDNTIACEMTSKEREKLEEMHYFVNLSHEYKIILWLWRKCGTSHMVRIMKNFDFKFLKKINVFFGFHRSSKNCKIIYD